MEKKDEGPLSDEEFRHRADECVDGISRLIQCLADEHGLTVDQVWEQFLDYMIGRASKLDPKGNPLPEGYDPFADPSHPMHGWDPRKDNEEPA